MSANGELALGAIAGDPENVDATADRIEVRFTDGIRIRISIDGEAPGIEEGENRDCGNDLGDGDDPSGGDGSDGDESDGDESGIPDTPGTDDPSDPGDEVDVSDGGDTDQPDGNGEDSEPDGNEHDPEPDDSGSDAATRRRLTSASPQLRFVEWGGGLVCIGRLGGSRCGLWINGVRREIRRVGAPVACPDRSPGSVVTVSEAQVVLLAAQGRARVSDVTDGRSCRNSRCVSGGSIL